MAYEQVKLVLAGMSGEIYMATVLKDGNMGDARRIATEDCLRATMEWFMSNNKKMVKYNYILPGEVPHLFFTKNKRKAERILKILNEE